MKDMVPVKPFRASTLRLSFAIEFATTVIVVDVGVRLKFGCVPSVTVILV
jgi:hypothetical protein